MPRRAAALLDDLDELPYRDRMTALAARARALAAAGRLAGALADLRAGWLTADDLRPLLAAAPAELDGSARGQVTRLKVRVVPGALTVCCPDERP